jgi:hypothetical protein
VVDTTTQSALLTAAEAKASRRQQVLFHLLCKGHGSFALTWVLAPTSNIPIARRGSTTQLRSPDVAIRFTMSRLQMYGGIQQGSCRVRLWS